MKSHLDSLLEALDLLVPGGIEEIDLSDPVELSGQPSELLVATRPGARWGLPVKAPSDLPVTLC
jgi:hypothetical protein